VWVAHPDGRITRFDPRPGRLKVNAEVRAGSGVEAIAGIEGHRAVWAISGQDRSLYRISNESSPRVAGRVTFASPPVGLTLTGRNVWVATQDGRLVQLVA
jgi:hypothetical protein